MSHFTVLVIGEDVPEQLEPYNENTDVEPYREDVYDPAEAMVSYGEALTYFTDNPDNKPTGLDEMDMLAVLSEYHGYPLEVDEDGTYYRMSTYNERSKWDWYVVGGRWRGYFQLRPGIRVGADPETRSYIDVPDPAVGQVGLVSYDTQAILGSPGTGEFIDIKNGKPIENYTGRADIALKGHIDFEAMRSLAGTQADATFDKLVEAVGDLPVPPRWDDMIEMALAAAGIPLKYSEQSEVQRKAATVIADKCREVRRADPWHAKLNTYAELAHYFGDPVEDFCLTAGSADYESARKTYTQRARDLAIPTYAVVKDGIWYERGSMGWWGMSSNEMPEEEWNRRFNDLLDGLSDDTMLTLVDAHI